MRYYNDAKYNAAFDRCVDVMSRLLQKYGPQVLDSLNGDTPADGKTESQSPTDNKAA